MFCKEAFFCKACLLCKEAPLRALLGGTLLQRPQKCGAPRVVPTCGAQLHLACAWQAGRVPTRRRQQR